MTCGRLGEKNIRRYDVSLTSRSRMLAVTCMPDAALCLLFGG